MSPKNEHARILLSKNVGGSIAYCEACNVIELEMGAISMRIDAPSLSALSALFKDADIRLNYYRLAKADFEEKNNYEQTAAPDLSFH
jgi:hypothetical protein